VIVFPLAARRAASPAVTHAARLGDHLEAAAYCVAALELHRRQHDRDAKRRPWTASAVSPSAEVDSTRHWHYQRSSRCAAKSAIPVSRPIRWTGWARPHTALAEHNAARTSWGQALQLYQVQHRDDDAKRIQKELDRLP
jgi:hypothetical protein